MLSGGAVGPANSVRFSSALEHAQGRTGGRYISLYSAAGRLGQFLGLRVALFVLTHLADVQLPLIGDDEGIGRCSSSWRFYRLPGPSHSGVQGAPLVERVPGWGRSRSAALSS